MSIQLIHADCGDPALELSPATLVYLDPPFCTGRTHYTKSGDPAFDDRWDTVNGLVDYWTPRIQKLWSAVKSGGSLVLHVDTRASHYFKVELDRRLGSDNFASEIVWRYRRWPSKTRNFQRVHDVLLRYVKPGAEPIWNQLYEPLAASTRETWGTGKQQAVTKNGRRTRSVATETESLGVPLGDVWDIGIIAPSARERTGYPTQKPMALLTRLISALTNPGDTVLDPCFGSGTTLVVAQQLGRNAIGIDVGDVAHRVTRERLTPAVSLQCPLPRTP